MKNPTSKDLTAIGEVLQESFSSLGPDQPVTIKSLKKEFIKKMGERFNGDRLYISNNKNYQTKSETIRKYLVKNYSIRKISEITGFSRSSVLRICKKIKK